MIHGADIETIRTSAREAILRHFVGIAEADGTPPTLRAMYAVKLAEARTVLAGGWSDYIAQEASLRNVTSKELAQVIADMGKQSEDLELARMRANVAIDAATDESEIHSILDPLGITVAVTV